MKTAVTIIASIKLFTNHETMIFTQEVATGGVSRHQHHNTIPPQLYKLLILSQEQW